MQVARERKAKRGSVEGRRRVGQYRPAMATTGKGGARTGAGRKARFKDRKRLPPIYVDGEMFAALEGVREETGVPFAEYARRLFAKDLAKRSKI